MSVSQWAYDVMSILGTVAAIGGGIFLGAMFWKIMFDDLF